jgi:hypothetical protein
LKAKQALQEKQWALNNHKWLANKATNLNLQYSLSTCKERTTFVDASTLAPYCRFNHSKVLLISQK